MFTKVCSVLLRTIHNRGPLRAFPYFRRCAPGKNLNVIEYFVYLYYGACFGVFVRDGMTLRIQRRQRLCPIFPESRHWDVRHLGVHASSPQSEVLKNPRWNLNLSLSLSLMLRPTISQPVYLGMKHPSGAYDQIFITLWSYKHSLLLYSQPQCDCRFSV
jgi:hypothetical protein